MKASRFDRSWFTSSSRKSDGYQRGPNLRTTIRSGSPAKAGSLSSESSSVRHLGERPASHGSTSLLHLWRPGSSLCRTKTRASFGAEFPRPADRLIRTIRGGERAVGRGARVDIALHLRLPRRSRCWRRGWHAIAAGRGRHVRTRRRDKARRDDRDADVRARCC